MCQLDIDSKSCGNYILPYNKTLIPDYGKKLDIFIKIEGDAELSSFSFFNKGKNRFKILNYYITELDNAEKQEDGSILINENGYIIYSNIEIEKYYCEFCFDGEINGNLTVNFDGESKKIENNIVSFTSKYDKHTLIVTAVDKPAKIKSIHCLWDISNQIEAAEFDAVYNAAIGNNDINKKYVHYTYNGSYICFNDINFYKSFNEFYLYASAENKKCEGILEIRIDSLDGNIIGECEISSTDNWDIFNEFKCAIVQTIGRHDLYFVWRSENKGNLFNIKKFFFKDRTY